MHHHATGFPPIVAKNPHTLILGSMPGLKSLEMQQYYAHPQNAFWKIMASLFDAPVKTYAERAALIKANGLALWDTLQYCERYGSLDTKIDDDTIVVNDFAAFFKKYPKITRVFFNGSKSEAEFKRRVLPTLSAPLLKRLSFARLPSTSPAHAGKGVGEKARAWAVVRN